MSTFDDLIKSNAKAIIGFVFLMGLAYGEIKEFRAVELRLEKKIKLIKENTDEIVLLKIKIAVLESKKCE